MKIKNLINLLQKYRIFRIITARLSPFMQKSGMLNILKFFNRGSFTDSWNMNDRTEFHDDDATEKYKVNFADLVQPKRPFTIGFLYKTLERDQNYFIGACNSLNLSYHLFDICRPDLFDEIKNNKVDALLVCPSIDNNIIRNVFHEISYLIHSQLQVFMYPTLLELSIYEAKRTLAKFLEINNIPHPKTTILYDLETATQFLQEATYPLVFKTHLGASASGVEILRNKKQAIRLARDLFKRYYLRKMETEYRASEWGYMLIQEFIKDVQEYRIVKVGDSWFGWQKWKTEKQEFMSGSGFMKWIDPSKELLDFCYNIAEKHHFTTMSYDIFVNSEGKFMVNELQTWFGSYDPTELYVNDVPGRYIKNNGTWTFEPGMFNVHGSIALRLVDIINTLNKNN